jgi:uncharacterized protein DUF4035
VEELLRTISSEEIVEWAAYYSLDPFGAKRGDMQAAIVASTMANIHAKKGHRFTPADFMPRFGEPEKTATMTADEMKAQLSMMFGRTLHG